MSCTYKLGAFPKEAFWDNWADYAQPICRLNQNCLLLEHVVLLSSTKQFNHNIISGAKKGTHPVSTSQLRSSVTFNFRENSCGTPVRAMERDTVVIIVIQFMAHG